MFGSFGNSAICLLGLMGLLALCPACRDGRFERQEYKISDRLGLILEQSRSEKVECKNQPDNDPQKCFSVHLDLLLKDLLADQEISHHRFETKVYLSKDQKIFDQPLSSDRDGYLQLEFKISVYMEQESEALPVFIDLYSETFGEVTYELVVVPSKQIDSGLDFKPVSKNDFENFRSDLNYYRSAELKDLRIENLAGTTNWDSNVEIMIVGRFLDTATQVELAQKKVTYEIWDPIFDTRTQNEVSLNDRGQFNIPLHLQRRSFDTEYQQRLDIKFQFTTDRYRSAYSYVLVLEPNSTPNIRLVSWQKSSDLDSSNYWTWNAIRYLSDDGPQLNLDDLEIVEKEHEILLSFMVSARTPSVFEAKKKRLRQETFQVSIALLRGSDLEQPRLRKVLAGGLKLSTNSDGRLVLSISQDKDLIQNPNIYIELSSVDYNYLPQLNFVINLNKKTLQETNGTLEWK